MIVLGCSLIVAGIFALGMWTMDTIWLHRLGKI